MVAVVPVPLATTTRPPGFCIIDQIPLEGKLCNVTVAEAEHVDCVYENIVGTAITVPPTVAPAEAGDVQPASFVTVYVYVAATRPVTV